ncbi:glutaredoxin family protein [Niallia taxi]|uniref:Glutaredoxin family protein n=1 Tax=Niallia taxi TaxID=2499688 RepID=A0A3S2X2P9_9BACI|nr:glutaredoxin family protein [Niallia taxi]MCM3213441.1 glutaredoxin family protein [Niallia taxi]MDK8640659.1 glutaredoxin family protein [Niallia taxi]MED3961178.1 glutaredoxin family protein [Niallia taxi]MED4036123.1 glutaredoxin family protein [Niallia taxi]MED4056477.1 glutaredoxin family protein [Niallia taxi]
MSQNKKVVVWSKVGCSYCEQVKSYLSENNFEYSTIDVTENDSLRDVLEVKYGIRYVPVVEIGDGVSPEYKAVFKVDLEALKEALV